MLLTERRRVGHSLSYSSIVRGFAAGAVLQFVAFREVFRVLGDFKLRPVDQACGRRRPVEMPDAALRAASLQSGPPNLHPRALL